MRPELLLPAGAEGAQPLVLDTNIVLDLLVFADPATAPLRALLAQGRLAWIATQPMRDELACVLAYPHVVARLHRADGAAAQVLAAFDAGARLVDEAPRAPCICKDADDQKFIDLAAAHGAVLLSKDQAVLRLRRRLAPLGAQVAVALRLADVER
ncbi:PIN domain-containing protein [Pulveribacter suum]|uniref:PIN domain nuclease n=1 Tax=Pulveribacter suum TaxID=2116657 RepID=A0A2P1NPE6_9BURK|nr:PIN domain-containing protein [Pulveribacter suum]AVP58934.1 PIN domain nuclease [Pulveribacter suum]